MNVEQSETTERTGPYAVFGAILLSLLGFGLVAFAMSTLAPWPDDFAITAKLEHLREHPEDYDTLFIGKSHVFRSFIPNVIDERLEQQGIRMRSFNLGGPGMSAPEIDHVLRTVLEIEGLHLKYVFIETPDWHDFANEDLETNRALNWHTPRQTWRAVRDVSVTTSTWGERSRLAWPHLKLLWMRATAYGQGEHFVVNRLVAAEQPLSAEAVARDRGYQGLDDLGTPEMIRRREAFVRNRSKYRQRVDGIISGNQQPCDLEHYDFEALTEQIDLIKAAGARPIYIAPPSMFPDAQAQELSRQGHLPDLMVFNDPVQYPDLYRFSRRFDGHLNQQGAMEFSQLFADHLLSGLN